MKVEQYGHIDNWAEHLNLFAIVYLLTLTFQVGEHTWHVRNLWNSVFNTINKHKPYLSFSYRYLTFMIQLAQMV